MTRLTIEIPDELVADLRKHATDAHTTAEAIAAGLVARGLSSEPVDPFASWVGCLHEDNPGWADDHDAVIAEEAIDPHDGPAEPVKG